MENNDINIYNDIKETNQSVYDSYNNFIFSNDTRVFNKMIKRSELYLNVKDIVGDILEFGVFKGASISLWLKLIDMYEPNSISKIIGFDFFDPKQVVDALNGINKNMMNNVVNRVEKNDLSIDKVHERLSRYNSSRYKLIKGDAVITSTEYINNNPGLKIKLLYMDLDVGEPTYQILKKLWNNISINGIIVFDEYAYHKWDESIGVDKFLKTIEGKYKQFPTNIFSPTFYIQKIKY
tara:strand:- start:3251 stop:3958 length:708 start_codon:yes stop_codon:yes gene_type:complete